jgi:hypothetical protein
MLGWRHTPGGYAGQWGAVQVTSCSTGLAHNLPHQLQAVAAGRVCLRICITVVGDLSSAALAAWFAGTREGLSASRHTEGGLDTLKAVAAQADGHF